MSKKLLLVVAAALFDGEGRVLLAERPSGKNMAGLWEFPGGKVAEDETPEAALCRELKEELGIAVDPADLAPITFASFDYPDFHLLMPLFACRRWQGIPHPHEGQRFVWATLEEAGKYPMPPADGPLLAALRKNPIKN